MKQSQAKKRDNAMTNNIFLVDFILSVVYINTCCDIDSVEA